MERKADSMEPKLKVAYILHRFPYLTETFIMREMYWLRAQGVELEIFSLLPPKHSLIHAEARELLPYAHYSPFWSWDILKAQLHFLRRSPGRYLRALAKAMWQTYREPKVLMLVLGLFPKSVYIARRMEALQVEHVHAHFVWLEGITAGIANDLIGVTFSIHPHAFGLFSRNQRDVRCELENASQVISVSSYHRNYIAKLCPKISPAQVEIVYYGIDPTYFRPAPHQPAASGPVRILSVGRLVEKKGYEYLIDACALLAKREIAFECQIVGDGFLSEALQARIIRHGLHERVTLLGALGQTQILELYQQSDIFALPCVRARDGDQDGLPNVLIEAMACELPVVTTPLTGIPDLVDDGENGFLVKERDVTSLAKALEKLVADEPLRRQLGQQGRQKVLAEFQIEPNAAKMAAIFRRVSRQYQPGTYAMATAQLEEIGSQSQL
jgi:glycosyltransferase involved in cell wall biosynthesis